MVTTQSSETDPSTLEEVELQTDSQTTRILIVVGEPTLRIAILSRFRLMGIDVEVASNGELAMEKLRRNQIDAVFLDLMLRETDSVKVIKKIRKDREFSDLPVFGYASAFSARQIRKVTKAGATKVFDENESSIDVIVAEIGNELFDGGSESTSADDSVDVPETPGQLLESVNRVRRHLERLGGCRNNALAAGYGELRGKVQRVINLSMRTGRYDMARLSSALQSVLKVYHEIPEHATESSLHTVTVAVEVLTTISAEASLAEGPHALEFTAAIVDDEMVSRSIVCSALRSVGFTFELFSHPAEVLRYAASHKTDLVVVNMCAEETAGFDVCQRLRDQEATENTPVLFVSGISEFRDRKKVISSGADEVITKPFIFMELSLKAISLALKNRFAKKDDPEYAGLAADGEPVPEEINDGSASVSVAADTDSMSMNRIAEHQRNVNRGFESEDADDFDALIINDVMNSLIAPSEESVQDTNVAPEMERSPLQEGVGQDETGASVEENEDDVARISEALREEREQREQLEVMVQQLMEAQGPLETDAQVRLNVEGGEEDGRASYDSLPPDIQEEMGSLASLTDELRVELEKKETLRVQLDEQLNAAGDELENVRTALELEREERESLQSKLIDSDATKVDSAAQDDALAEARVEIEKTAALVQEKSDRSQKLEAQLQEISEQLEKSNVARRELTEERESKEKELNRQILVAKTAADEAAARQQKGSENVVALRGEVDRLKQQLKSKQETDETLSVEIDRKKSKLEQSLKDLTNELEASKAAQKLQATEWDKQVAALKKELDAATDLAEQAEARSVEHARQVKKLEKSLEKQREEIDSKLACAVGQSEDVAKQRGELENRLREAGEKLQEAGTAREKLLSERKLVESELRDQLKAAQSVADKTEAEAQKNKKNNTRLETDIKQLQGRRKELESKLEAGTKEIGQLKKQKTDLNGELQKTRDELKQSAGARERLIAERKQFEKKTGKELSNALAAAKKAETAAMGESQLTGELKTELEKLRKVQGGLESKLKSSEAALANSRKQSSESESRANELQKNCDSLKSNLDSGEKRLAELADKKFSLENTLESTRASLKKVQEESKSLAAQKDKIAKEFDQKVGEHRRAAQVAEATAKKETERGNKFEAEVTGLWQVRDDLQGKLATEKKYATKLKNTKSELEAKIAEGGAALDEAKATLDQKNKELADLQKQHAEVAEAKAALDAEVASLREQQKNHKRELATMERRVRENVGLLTRATADLETERGERRRTDERSESLSNKLRGVREELNHQIQLEKDNQIRVAGLEKQILEKDQTLDQEKTAHENERSVRRRADQKIEALGAGLDSARSEITQQLQETKAHQTRVTELEQQLRVREESLVRVTEHLESERGERRRIEKRAAGVDSKLQETQKELAAKKKMEKEQTATIADLGEKLNGRENALVESMAALEAERNERGQLEHRAAEMSAQMKTLNSDLNEALETEKNFRSRVAGLEEDVRDRNSALEQAQADLAKEMADSRLASKQIEAAAEMGSKLAQYQNAFDDSRQSFDQTQVELESRIKQSGTELEERDAKLQTESEARRKAEKELESARKKVHDMEQQGTIEVSKLRSALQAESMERRRLESDAASSRFATLNNSRSGQAMVNGLRKQLRTPVDQLMNSARQMLEFKLQSDLKKVAEGVLENALALQTTVRETDVVEVPADETDVAGKKKKKTAAK